MKKETLKEVMTHLAKQSHKKHPRGKEHFSLMGKKSAEARKKVVDNSPEDEETPVNIDS